MEPVECARSLARVEIVVIIMCKRCSRARARALETVKLERRRSRTSCWLLSLIHLACRRTITIISTAKWIRPESSKIIIFTSFLSLSLSLVRFLFFVSFPDSTNRAYFSRTHGCIINLAMQSDSFFSRWQWPKCAENFQPSRHGRRKHKRPFPS